MKINRLWQLEEAPKWAAAEEMEIIKAEAEAKVDMITIPMPGTTKMHIRRNTRDEEKDLQDEEKGKGKGKGTDYGQQLVVHMDGKEYMRDRPCYNCGTLGHYARDCAEAWKQHYERKNKRNHYEMNALFNNGEDNYFDENDHAEKYSRNSSMLLFEIAEGSEFQTFCDDAKANNESPTLTDGGAESSVTNNEELLVNIGESTAILEGFNGATAKAQGQGGLTFSTPCHITEWFSKQFGKIVPNGECVLTVDACLITASKLTILSEKDMRNLGYVRADSTLGKPSYTCAENGNIIIPRVFNGTLWITIKRPPVSQSI